MSRNFPKDFSYSMSFVGGERSVKASMRIGFDSGSSYLFTIKLEKFSPYSTISCFFVCLFVCLFVLALLSSLSLFLNIR